MKIPDGWHLQKDDWGRQYAVLSTPSPMSLSATIDWARRGFRSGVSVTGPLASTKTYTGRGWRDALLADAIAYLDKIL